MTTEITTADLLRLLELQLYHARRGDHQQAKIVQDQLLSYCNKLRK